jgi:hypothetical protein
MEAARGMKVCAFLLMAMFLAGGVSRAELLAYDQADLDDPYGNQNTFMPGQNGGAGFDAWVQIEQGMFASMFLADAVDADHIRSWGMSGTYALGRGLQDTLDEGIWNFSAFHGATVNSFSGFTLRTSVENDAFATGEILRVGLIDGVLNYSTDQGDTYTSGDSADDWRDMNVQYSILWSTVSGNFSLTVSAENDPDLSESMAGTQLAIGDPVAMLGVGIFENTTSEQLRFDDFQISVIPEPTTLAFVLAGSLLLICCRN